MNTPFIQFELRATLLRFSHCKLILSSKCWIQTDKSVVKATFYVGRNALVDSIQMKSEYVAFKDLLTLQLIS